MSEGTNAGNNAPRPNRALKIALVGTLAAIVALAVFIALLLLRFPEVMSQVGSQQQSEPTGSSASPSTVDTGPTAEPEGDDVPQESEAPSAPDATPITIDSMGATILTDECSTTSTIILTWATTGASANSAVVTANSGSGTPVVNQTFTNRATSGEEYIHLIDCTRPFWTFTLTVTNGTQTKKAVLTCANGKMSGWSWGSP